MGRSVVAVACLLVSCAQTKAVTAPPPPPKADWACVAPDASEEGALACDVVDALFAQARLAKAEPARVVIHVTADGFTAEVERAGVSTTVALPLRSHVFAPLTWAPLARPLFGEPEPGAGAMKSAVLVALSEDASAKAVLEQATSVAAELEAGPRKSFVHVKAGLILSVLAWREGGVLADPRELLALATAHLALAAGLWPRQGGDALPHGNDELVAWTLIDALVSASEARRAVVVANAGEWRGPLQVTVDGNWKTARGSPTPVGLERLVRAQVLAARAGSDAMESALASWGSPGDPFFSRVLFGPDLKRPVSTMRRHAEDLPDRERIEREELLPFVARGASVIPEGAWRRHFSRNAIGAAVAQEALHRYTLQRPDDAQRVFAHARDALANDPLWPAARLLFASPTRADCDAVPADLHAAPFRVRAAVAAWCQRATPRLDTPRGTVFDADFRFTVTPSAKSAPSQRDAWLELSPSSFGPRWLELQEIAPERMTQDRAVEVLGPLLAYDQRAVNAATDLVPRPTQAALEAACESERVRCFDLVMYLRSNDLPYIDVLERWRKDPGSRVAFSNLARPLLDHYFEENRKADAEALAQEVAATGSSRGLEIQAVFFERTGRCDAAERVYRDASERYRNPFLLDDFYLRAAARKYQGGRFAAKARQAQLELFGGPAATVKKAQLQASDRGVSLQGFSDPWLFAFGLRKSDVVLAADGVRVKTSEQFTSMLHRSERPTLTVIVVRDGAVLELTGKFRRQRYGR